MTSIEIKTVLELRENPSAIKQIEDIFFLTTSKKKFVSQGEKKEWSDKWLSLYIDHFAHLFLLAFKSNQLLGYLSGCDNTFKYWDNLLENHKYYAIFEDLIKDFPAHLHINCHPQSQGMGVGSLLVNTFLNLKDIQKGVHILTGPREQNVTFYLKNNFNFMLERKYKNNPILFMGKSLYSQSD